MHAAQATGATCRQRPLIGGEGRFLASRLRTSAPSVLSAGFSHFPINLVKAVAFTFIESLDRFAVILDHVFQVIRHGGKFLGSLFFGCGHDLGGILARPFFSDDKFLFCLSPGRFALNQNRVIPVWSNTPSAAPFCLDLRASRTKA